VHQAFTLALWVVHTYLIDVFNISPLLIINAPEKACGKTLLLKILAWLCFRPIPAANATSSVIFRLIEMYLLTLLLDEADTFLRDNKELHGMINAGFEKGASVLRNVPAGDGFEPRKFSVYSAKAIAGIALEKHLPDATMSRGIIINMRRKLLHEKVDRLRNADTAMFDVIKSKLARFALDYAERLKHARPPLPDELSDRDQDKWEPLLAIAECAGDEWLKRATEAALELSNTGEVSLCIGAQLLLDIQCIFNSDKHPEKISSEDLVEALCKDEEAPWKTYNYGKSITQRQLAKLLKPYGIESRTVRVNKYSTLRGYYAEDFQDAFERYIPAKKQ